MMPLESLSVQVPVMWFLGIAASVFFGLLSWLLIAKVNAMDEAIKTNTLDIQATNKKLNEVNLEILREMKDISIEIAKYKKP